MQDQIIASHTCFGLTDVIVNSIQCLQILSISSDIL